jgi:hypothetical protein
MEITECPPRTCPEMQPSGRRVRCTFQMLGGQCPRMCNANKAIQYCASHMNRKPYTKCLNDDCSRGSYSKTGLCRYCGQSKMRNRQVRAQAEVVKHHCDLCNVNVAGWQNHITKCRKHIRRATLAAALKDTMISSNKWLDVMDMIKANVHKIQ